VKAAATFFFSIAFFSTSLKSQSLTVDAGNVAPICPGTSVTIGGTPTASGGTSPYTYAWTPATGLSGTAVPNPISTPAVPTWYFVTVTDAVGASKRDSILVNLDPSWAYNAGNDTSICIGETVQLGSIWNSFNGGVTYFWAPSLYLDNPNAPRPTSSTTVTITYSVTITSPNCNTKTSTITVTVNPLPTVTACCATTINEGSTATLTASGGIMYNWTPSSTISNPYGSPTTAEPITSTLYTVYGVDQNGCNNWDTVTVTVIPSSEIYFYNTFSPNGDGINDLFYIGNVVKYPNNRLEVYTRTGQLVYAKSDYDNSWDGTNYGDKLPAATYYYTFNPGDGSPAKFGSVTIVR
jgi:gliding motility-associated-like protein